MELSVFRVLLTLLEAWQLLSPCAGEMLLPSNPPNQCLVRGEGFGITSPELGALLCPCPTLMCSCPCTRSVGHTHRRVTEHLKVPYYVSESFAEEYTGANLKNVERSVEDDYIANLRNNCWREKQQSEY